MPRKVRTLQAQRPDIARDWHPTRNGTATPGTTAVSSMRRAWWRCAVDDRHDWHASPNSRTSRTSGCPYCGGKRINDSNSLAVRRSQPTGIRRGTLARWASSLVYRRSASLTGVAILAVAILKPRIGPARRCCRRLAAMDHTVVAASETIADGAHFHFVLDPQVARDVYAARTAARYALRSRAAR